VCANLTVTVAHTAIQCNMSASTHVNETVTFTIDGQSAGPATLLYSTQAPTLTSVPSIATDAIVAVNLVLGAEANANTTEAGPWLVIIGTNLGFQNDPVIVTVGGYVFYSRPYRVVYGAKYHAG
jgi:hypothetical protein